MYEFLLFQIICNNFLRFSTSRYDDSLIYKATLTICIIVFVEVKKITNPYLLVYVFDGKKCACKNSIKINKTNCFTDFISFKKR